MSDNEDSENDIEFEKMFGLKSEESSLKKPEKKKYKKRINPNCERPSDKVLLQRRLAKNKRKIVSVASVRKNKNIAKNKETESLVTSVPRSQRVMSAFALAQQNNTKKTGYSVGDRGRKIENLTELNKGKKNQKQNVNKAQENEKQSEVQQKLVNKKKSKKTVNDSAVISSNKAVHVVTMPKSPVESGSLIKQITQKYIGKKQKMDMDLTTDNTVEAMTHLGISCSKLI